MKRSRKISQEPLKEHEIYKGPANPICQRVSNNTNKNGQAVKWTGEPITEMTLNPVEK